MLYLECHSQLVMCINLADALVAKCSNTYH
jgi:hypothetical protein